MRIEPLTEPFEPHAAEILAAMMPPGVAPIALFRTFAKNLEMAEAMRQWGGYELSRHLSVDLRSREIVIDRTCARCGCEYEWGVHVSYFAERARLTDDQVRSLTAGAAGDDCWIDACDRVLIRFADELHDASDLSDDLWQEASHLFSDAQILDLLMLAGWYHAISFTARAAAVPLEPGAPRFADYGDATGRSPK